MHRLALGLLVVSYLGCSSSGNISTNGTVTTGGSSDDLAFAPLVKGARPDLAVLSASRGVVEVYTPAPSGGFTDVGSFFDGNVGHQLITGTVGGAGVVGVLWDQGTIVLLPGSATAPHQLTGPYQVFRRFRNGAPVDTTPPAAGAALADLDGDGSDDLIVGAAGGLFLVPGKNMEPVLQAVPEKPPPANGFNYDAGPDPGAVAAVDVDGDGHRDVVLLDQKEATARVYSVHGALDQVSTPAVVKLPAVGTKVVVTGCPALPFAVLLNDGSMVAVTRDGKAQPLAAELKPIKAVASSRDSVAMTYGPDTKVALYDACGQSGSGVFPNLPQLSVLAITIAPSNMPNAQEMALLGADRKTVDLYSLTGY